MGFSFKVSGPDAGIVKRQKAKAKAKSSGSPQPSELHLILKRRSGQPWGFSLSDDGAVDGIHDDSPAAKAVRSQRRWSTSHQHLLTSEGGRPGLRCGDRIVAVFVPSKGGMVATPTGRAAKDLIKDGLDHLDVKIQRGKRAVVENVAKAPSTQKESTKKESTQKASWRIYHREKLLKDLPKWKVGHKEDMHTRLHKVQYTPRRSIYPLPASRLLMPPTCAHRCSNPIPISAATASSSTRSPTTITRVGVSFSRVSSCVTTVTSSCVPS